MNIKKAAIALVLVSTAGALWASMTVPALPIPGFAARLARPSLSPVRRIPAPAASAPLDDRIRVQALVLSQA